MDTIADWVTPSCQNRHGECFCGSWKRLSMPFLGWLSYCRDPSATEQKNTNESRQWFQSLPLRSEPVVRRTTFSAQCWLILKEILSCFLFPGHVWYLWWTKMHFFGYSCSYVCWVHGHYQRMFLFHMLIEAEFQGSRSKLGRREESLLLSWQTLCQHSAEHLSRWGWQLIQNIGFGEKASVHVAASDTSLVRDLSGEACPFFRSENSLFWSRKESETYLSLQGTTAARRKGVRCGYQTQFF